MVTVASWDNSGHVFRIGQRTRLLTLLGSGQGIADATFNHDGTSTARPCPATCAFTREERALYLAG